MHGSAASFFRATFGRIPMSLPEMLQITLRQGCTCLLCLRGALARMKETFVREKGVLSLAVAYDPWHMQSTTTQETFMPRSLLFAFTFLLFCSPVRAAEWQERPEIAAVFAGVNAQGTFVLYDLKADRFVGHNRERAEMRFVPASTFKIPNTLIGLSVGAIRDVDEVLPYGGKPQSVKAWERDMSLREAIQISNVPVYQELARRIGLERMRTEVARLHYGNTEIGTVVDRFWLDGPLRISAVEQVRFLARLTAKELPVSAEAQAAVRDILLVEQTSEWSLFAKTGLALSVSPSVGWWVGWVEKSGRVYVFALNMDMSPDSSPAVRIELGKACLKALKVL